MDDWLVTDSVAGFGGSVDVVAASSSSAEGSAWWNWGLVMDDGMTTGLTAGFDCFGFFDWVIMGYMCSSSSGKWWTVFMCLLAAFMRVYLLVAHILHGKGFLVTASSAVFLFFEALVTCSPLSISFRSALLAGVASMSMLFAT
jgi:hypothetical protein